MGRRVVFALICLVVLACLRYPIIGHERVAASSSYAVHNVNSGLSYATIQEAVNANETLEGHVIHVDAGTYYVNFTSSNVINKSVSLVGDGLENTTIISTIPMDLPRGFFPLINVVSDHVNISGFTLRLGQVGVFASANYVHITNCNISDDLVGINMYGHGQLVGEVIDRNILINNTEAAIWIAVNNSVVCDNAVLKNGGGIIVCGGEQQPIGNFVYENTVENNGPYYAGCNVGGHDNTIILNNFLNNSVQAASIFGKNMWDGRLSPDDLLWGGNFWSDYNYTNAYGLGDVPYVIDTNNTDRYPLTGRIDVFYPLNSCEVAIVSNSSLSDFAYTLINNTESTLSFKVTGENGADGFCRIIVPQALIDHHKTWSMTLDGEKWQSTFLSSNATHWMTWILYSHSSHQIEIRGQVTTLPEFPTPTLLTLFSITALLAIVLYKRRH
jgi:hypothetical protein